MKTINFFLTTITAIALILLVSPVDSFAQKEPIKTDQKKKVKKPATVTSVSVCDELVAAKYSELEMRANKTCSSTKATIKCEDSKTGRPIYITVIAKPATEGCANTVKIANKKGVTMQPQSRGGADAATADATSFDVEVLQRHCQTGGVQLSAYIPGDDDARERYMFDWKTADEKTIVSDRDIECTSEREITLTVTDKETKQSVTKNITIDRRAAKMETDH